MKVTARVIMTVYGLQSMGYGHRTNGPCDPKHASVISNRVTGLYVFEELLEKLQARGVKPGTELKITVETVRPKRKTGKKK